MKPRIQRVFLNVSMSNRIEGLQKIAIGSGIKLHELDPQSYLIFVNAAKDKVAMLVGSATKNKEHTQIMAYKKMGAGQAIDLRVLAEMPRYFDGKRLDYDQALNAALDAALKRKSDGKVLALE